MESLQAILAICAARQEGKQPHHIMALDVARAYFYAPASRPVFIQIPAADRLGSDAGKVAQLNLSLSWHQGRSEELDGHLHQVLE